MPASKGIVKMVPHLPASGPSSNRAMSVLQDLVLCRSLRSLPVVGLQEADAVDERRTVSLDVSAASPSYRDASAEFVQEARAVISFPRALTTAKSQCSPLIRQLIEAFTCTTTSLRQAQGASFLETTGKEGGWRSGNERFDVSGSQEIRGLYILLLILGASNTLSNEAQADGPPSAPEAFQGGDSEEDLQVHDLRPAGDVKTNSHTARWRIYTDTGRDHFARVRAVFGCCDGIGD